MKKTLSVILSTVLALILCAASADGAQDKAEIESALNLSNNPDQEWTYDAASDAWTLSVVSAVTRPVIPDEEGVSVCVPGAYVTGIDTDGDGTADVTAAEDPGAVKGGLVIDYAASVTSTNGQTYTAATAPVILNTGAAGYGNSTNTTASAAYAVEGYINVACGNRGKQDSTTDDAGNTVYTGDAPSCLADQKAAARFVRYNILLGNLPGSVEHWVSTGGSGGGAHAVMFAATSDHPDFYDYQIAVGAVGVYRLEDGSYCTTVNVNGEEVALSDGAWGCVAYSPITSLYEADMAMAFEYTLDTDYTFNTAFQKELAACLAREYMETVNSRNLSVEEEKVGFDLDGDGLLESTVALTIEVDAQKYAETNGYGGSYLDLYLAEFTENLQWMLDNLAYADGWTWFGTDGAALSDEAVAAMTAQEKAQAFLEGRYTKSSSRGGMGRMGGFGGQGRPEGLPDGAAFGGPDGARGAAGGDEMLVGTPDAGTTQASGSTTDSANYGSYADMVAAYRADIAEIEAGDTYGKNIVTLYNPLAYIGAEGTHNPVWVRMVSGAAEGDISMFNSLNLQLAFLNAGVDATVEWQWDGGHVPSEILGNSLALTVDEMFGAHTADAQAVEKPAAQPQTANGTAETASGTDLTGWVALDEEGKVSFTLQDAAAYRTKAASKACPGFDVIDYGQEDYVFGDSDTNARHWSTFVLRALEENEAALSPLFNR